MCGCTDENKEDIRMFKSYSMELGGRTLTLEFGKYAEQASGSCFVRYGDTCVLTTCTVAKTPRPGIDFFPLSVDFEEKLYSVGHIPGSWNRREGRPAEKAILTSRLIDRPLRPLFPKGMRHDVSVVATVMSVDTNNIPDIPAMIGASASLATSEIPWAGPIGAVNIGYVDGEYIVNPNDEQREESLLNLTVAGTAEKVVASFPPVHLQLADGSTYQHEGKVAKVSGVIDEATGSVQMIAQFPNPEHLLKSGGSGSIVLKHTNPQAIVVPKSCTVELQNKIFVYLLGADNKAKYTEITVEPQNDGNNYVVTGGLKPGDKYVTNGITKLTDGAAITPITPEEYAKRIKQAEGMGAAQK